MPRENDMCVEIIDVLGYLSYRSTDRRKSRVESDNSLLLSLEEREREREHKSILISFDSEGAYHCIVQVPGNIIAVL